MATVNFNQREILCKIVYYGPGLSGKTTNLQLIHNRMPEQRRGKLTSVATSQDRTIFFDLLPLEVGKIRDFKVKLQLYTVPGQVYYNSTRKIVLMGVDGVVFVADSQRSKMFENAESLSNLKDNLRDNGIDPLTVPVVIQYNKRDLDLIYPVPELNLALNPNNLSHFEAVALTGHGVFNTLKGITSLVLNDVKERLSAKSSRLRTNSAEEPVYEKSGVSHAAESLRRQFAAPARTVDISLKEKAFSSVETNALHQPILRVRSPLANLWERLTTFLNPGR